MIRLLYQTHRKPLLLWILLQVVVMGIYWGSGLYDWSNPTAFRSIGLHGLFWLAFVLMFAFFVGYVGFVFNLQREGNWISALPIDRDASKRTAALLVIMHGLWFYALLFPVLRTLYFVTGVPSALLFIVFPLVLLGFSIRTKRTWLGIFLGLLVSFTVMLVWSVTLWSWTKLQWRLPVEGVTLLAGTPVILWITGWSFRSAGMITAVAFAGFLLPEVVQRVALPVETGTEMLNIRDFPAQYKVDRLVTRFTSRREPHVPLFRSVQVRSTVGADPVLLHLFGSLSSELFSPEQIKILLHYIAKHPSEFSYASTDPRDLSKNWSLDFDLLRRRLDEPQKLGLGEFRNTLMECELLEPEADPQALRALLSKKCLQGPSRSLWRVTWADDQLSRLQKVSEILRSEIQASLSGRVGPIGLSPDEREAVVSYEKRHLEPHQKPGDYYVSRVASQMAKKTRSLENARGKSYSEFKSMLLELKAPAYYEQEPLMDWIRALCDELGVECPRSLMPWERRSWNTFLARKRFVGEENTFNQVEAARRVILADGNRDRVIRFLNAK